MSHELFPKDSLTRLSANADTWNESIQQHLVQKYNSPDLVSKIDRVVFSKIDKIKGYGVGYILIQDLDLRIPFIIKNLNLLPMDVIVKDGKYYHLNHQTLERLITSTWPFAGPASVGRQMQGSGLNKMASIAMLELTKEAFEGNPELMKYASEIAETHPSVIVSIDKHFKKPIEKTASETRVEFAHLEISEDRTKIMNVGFGKADEFYTIKTASEKFGRDAVSSVLANGVHRVGFDTLEKRASEIVPTVVPQFKAPESESIRYPQTISMYDGFAGYIRGNLYHCRPISEPNHRTAMIFLSTATKEPFYDVVTKGHTRKFVTIPEQHDMVDDMVRPAKKVTPTMPVGLMMNSEVYGPFVILNDAEFPGGKRIYNIVDTFNASKFTLTFSDTVKEIVVNKKEIIAPSLVAHLVWMGEPISAAPMEKNSSVAVRLVTNVNKTGFDLLDNGVSRIPAAALKGMNKGRAVTALMHCGLTEEESKTAIAKAMERSSYEFSATPTAVASNEGNAAAQSDMPKMQKTASSILNTLERYDMLKIAKDMLGDESVDVVLGLKMITPETVRRYKLLNPRITDTIDGLCRLLCAIRLGGEQIVPIDENKLSAVIAGLNEIAFELSGV